MKWFILVAMACSVVAGGPTTAPKTEHEREVAEFKAYERARVSGIEAYLKDHPKVSDRTKEGLLAYRPVPGMTSEEMKLFTADIELKSETEEFQILFVSVNVSTGEKSAMVYRTTLYDVRLRVADKTLAGVVHRGDLESY